MDIFATFGNMQSIVLANNSANNIINSEYVTKLFK